MIKTELSYIDRIDNQIKVVSTPYTYKIAEGEMPEHYTRRILGYRAALTNGTIDDVSELTAVAIPLPTVVTPMEVVSSDARDAGAYTITAFADGTAKVTVTTSEVHGLINGTAITITGSKSYNGNWVVANTAANSFTILATWVADDAKGTVAASGARSVEIHGLDEQWEKVKLTVNLKGLNAVAVGSLIRINNIHVMTAGTTGASIGVISLRDVATGAIIYSNIAAGGNMAFSSHCTVPANTYGYITGWAAGSTAAKPCRFTLRAKRDWDTHELISIWHTQDIINCDSSYTSKEFVIPIRLPPKCDVKISALATGAGSSGATSMEVWLEEA